MKQRIHPRRPLIGLRAWGILLLAGLPGLATSSWASTSPAPSSLPATRLNPLARELQIARTVVIANTDDPESLDLARHYLEARGIPSGNLLAFSFPLKDTISWEEYVNSIYNPLRTKLAAEGWLHTISTGESASKDSRGRLDDRVLSHRIAYLVLMKGVPLRIAHDPATATPEAWENLAAELRRNPAFQNENLLNSVRQHLDRNHASVDSELATLALPPAETLGPLSNPLFRRAQPHHALLNNIVRTARIDGPDAAAVRRMIDDPLKVEKSGGLDGLVYLDWGSRPGEQANQWIELASKAFETLDYLVIRETTTGTFPADTPFDEAAFYLGWYAHNVNGPFANPGFSFLPGAVAVHLHSYSAAQLRDPAKNWCAPLLARGAAATLGNVYEPLLGFTHYFDLFTIALLNGENFADAAWFSIPVLSWQGLALGDPLYRPFPVPRKSSEDGGS